MSKKRILRNLPRETVVRHIPAPIPIQPPPAPREKPAQAPEEPKCFLVIELPKCHARGSAALDFRDATVIGPFASEMDARLHLFHEAKKEGPANDGDAFVADYGEPDYDHDHDRLIVEVKRRLRPAPLYAPMLVDFQAIPVAKRGIPTTKQEK